MNTNHSPLPWESIGSHKAWFIRTKPVITSGAVVTIHESIAIAEVRESEEQKANAAYIVRACNAYPALVEALEGLLADKYLADPINADRMANARAALALARGGVVDGQGVGTGDGGEKGESK